MEGEAPRTKLEEQATGKGVYSYTYFAASTAGNATAPPPPRKLTEEEAAAQTQLEKQRSAQGSSAWNHAGTFEEKDWTSWAKEKLASLLKGAEVPVVGSKHKGVSLRIEEVTDLAGHANAWFVRGKKTHGFDLEFSVSWAATVGASQVQVQGSCKVPSAGPDDLDDDDDLVVETPEVKSKEADKAAASLACSALTASLPSCLRGKLKALLKELKEK